MLRFYRLQAILCIALSATNAVAATPEPEQRVLHIGVEAKRAPYSTKGENHSGHGFLADYVQSICALANFKCQIWSSSFHGLTQDLKRSRLDAIVIIDTIVFETIDELKLTAPLCQLTPLFIQPRKAPSRAAMADFHGTHIGVLSGSVLHLHLLETYSAEASIKPYFVLESGIFDLVAGRIGALFTDELFFETRILPTFFGQPDHKDGLTSVIPLDSTFKPNITLAVNSVDLRLAKKFDTAIQEKGTTPSCKALMQVQKPNTGHQKP